MNHDIPLDEEIAKARQLIDLARAGSADASGHVLLYHTVLDHLISGQDSVLQRALGELKEQGAQQLLTTCIKTISTHWICQLPRPADAPKVLASLFLVPFTAMIAPGSSRISPLSLSDPGRLADALECQDVIKDAAHVYIGSQILTMDEIGSLTPSQRFGLTKRLCDSISKTGQLEVPLSTGVLSLESMQAAVVPYFLIGLALSDSRARMPTFDSATTEGTSFTRQAAELLGDLFQQAGFEALVEVYRPALFPDAVDTGYYRAKLNALELQIGLQQHIHELSGEACAVIISVHDDGFIRISLHDKGDKSMKLTFPWDIVATEDIEQSVLDIEKAVQDRGIHDIRIIEGVQFTETRLQGEECFPTLSDLEHAGVTLQ
jgi:hypothetical protein